MEIGAQFCSQKPTLFLRERVRVADVGCVLDPAEAEKKNHQRKKIISAQITDTSINGTYSKQQQLLTLYRTLLVLIPKCGKKIDVALL